jgi:hypothetical protein
VQEGEKLSRQDSETCEKYKLKWDAHIKVEVLIYSLQHENANLKKLKTKVQRKTRGACFECPHCDGDTYFDNACLRYFDKKKLCTSHSTTKFHTEVDSGDRTISQKKSFTSIGVGKVVLVCHEEW